MKLAVYSTKQYDKKYLQQVNESFGFELEFFDFLLTEKTAKTANGCEAVCICRVAAIHYCLAAP